MKKWTKPVINELNINDTEHCLLGNSRDGGYIGDGIISGHLGWKTKCGGSGGNQGGSDGNQNGSDGNQNGSGDGLTDPLS